MSKKRAHARAATQSQLFESADCTARATNDNTNTTKQLGAPHALRLDLRERAPGIYVGGKVGYSIACPVCHKAAVRMPRSANKDRWAHVIVFKLNPNNEPAVTLLERCERDVQRTFSDLKILIAPGSMRRQRARARAKAHAPRDPDTDPDQNESS